MTQNNEQRLLGRMVAMDMTQDAESVSGEHMAASTIAYTWVGGWREVDRADNGDQIP